MCVLFSVSFIRLHVYAFAIHSMVHCMSFAMPQGTGARLAEGATKGTAYARTTVFQTCLTSPKHVSLLATVRSLGPFSIIFQGRISLVATYAKGQRQQHDWCLARVLALHVLPACAYFAPVCVYLALVCAFASLLSWHIQRVCERMWCLRGPLVHVCPALFCACLPCACACALYCIWSTFSIPFSSPTL